MRRIDTVKDLAKRNAVFIVAGVGVGVGLACHSALLTGTAVYLAIDNGVYRYLERKNEKATSANSKIVIDVEAHFIDDSSVLCAA